jgi:hypothetical protein
MQVTSTTYIDFLLATGLTRVRKVRDARRQYEEGYTQGSDFYRPMREGIVAMHRAGRDPDDLDRIVAEALPRRQGHFQACADGYRKFMKDRSFVWTRRPKPETWSHGGLHVLVNPELLLTVDGRPHRVKLYFKGEALKQSRADLLIELLKSAGDDGSSDIAILDVRRSRMFTQKKSSSDFPVLLRAEALSFVAMWDAIGREGRGEKPATG